MLYYLSFLYNIHHTFLIKKKLKNEILRGGGPRGHILSVAAGYNASWSHSKLCHPLLKFIFQFFLVQKCVMYIIEKRKIIKHSQHFPSRNLLIPDFPPSLSSDHKTTIFLLCM